MGWACRWSCVPWSRVRPPRGKGEEGSWARADERAPASPCGSRGGRGDELAGLLERAEPALGVPHGLRRQMAHREGRDGSAAQVAEAVVLVVAEARVEGVLGLVGEQG